MIKINKSKIKLYEAFEDGRRVALLQEYRKQIRLIDNLQDVCGERMFKSYRTAIGHKCKKIHDELFNAEAKIEKRYKLNQYEYDYYFKNKRKKEG